MHSSTVIKGPLSWQQERALAREAQNGQGEAFVTTFAIPDTVTDDELGRRLIRMVDREPNLRAVDADAGGITYASSVDPPLRHEQCSEAQEIRTFISEQKHIRLERGKSPLWNLTVVRHQTVDGRPVRTAIAVFDHLIADMGSAALLRRELCTGAEGAPGKGAGQYHAWVAEQRREFDPTADTDARRFWLSHLGGTFPTHATPLPGIADAEPGQGSGSICLSGHVPVSSAALRAACHKNRATPFILVLGAVAATAAQSSGADEITLQAVTSGRTARSAETFGCLNSSMPIRLRHPDLGNFDSAVSVASAAWQQVLPYQHTPWDYLWEVADVSDGAMRGWAACRRELIVNFMPAPVEGISEHDVADQRSDRIVEYLSFEIFPLASGGFMFRMAFDPSDMEVESVRDLLQRVKNSFTDRVQALH
ncbi:condensation domain-containing protein [Streptomyces cavernae]|uniref:condensation domain-containing protein n=1 Tax=Streptomyces cavernae TaxID=2259034 RepID=UPI000FEB7259|nr:condensation domain-containing protein [Streptomyces cavernae]